MSYGQNIGEYRNNYAESLIVVKFFYFVLKISVLNKLDFLSSRRSLEGLKSSGRLVGRISTYFRQKRFGGFRAMIKNAKKVTTKKATTINM